MTSLMYFIIIHVCAFISEKKLCLRPKLFYFEDERDDGQDDMHSKNESSSRIKRKTSQEKIRVIV